MSYYCPQCLLRYMDDEVTRFHRKCSKCLSCPCCNGIIVDIVTHEGHHRLHCDYCFWEADKPLVSQERKGIDQATERKGVSPSQVVFDTLLKKYKGKFDRDDSKKKSAGAAQLADQSEKQWTWREADKLYSSLGSGDDLGPAPTESQAPTEAQEDLGSREYRKCEGVSLRTKRTLRCRKDVEEGKMSILLQPKNFALEGDSSLKLQRGKWSVKDTSAIYHVPNITVEGMSGNMIKLRIRNPMDEACFVRICPAVAGDRQDSSAAKPKRNCDDPFVTVPTESPIIQLGGSEDALLAQEGSDDEVQVEAGDTLKYVHGWVVTVRNGTARITGPLSDPNSIAVRFTIRVSETEQGLQGGSSFHVMIQNNK